MKETEVVKTLRREFLAASPFLLLGAASLKASSLSLQAAPKGSGLRENLNPKELAMVNKSAMAGDMDNYWHKGYSCAESGLMVALRFMKKPENLVWVAGGFGGGIGHHDLCGFLTAGIMAIGLHSGSLKMEAKNAKTRCSQKVNEYWDWWVSTAPLHCREIREGRKGFNVCQRLGKLACVKLETLLKA
ncbi:MAG: C-GCAxxG-C-C family protein [Acidobacteria bacterium]|nr:C-GCAxxG-C-C family protein [Acidobacteriota bacterium]